MEKKKRRTSLIINDTKYYTNLTDKFVNRKKWEKPNEKILLSYIPGTINKIYVKEGQKVKVNQRLLILEAMKMRNVIKSNLSGIIKKIYVNEKEIVPKNHVLIEFE